MLSKMCSDVDDHYCKLCVRMCDFISQILNSHPNEVSYYLAKQLVARVVLESQNVLNLNKIKIVYMGAMFNTLNQRFPLLVDSLVSVLIRKFRLLIPLDSKLPENMREVPDYLYNLGFLKKASDGLDQVPENRLRSEISKKMPAKFEEFYSRLETYSIVYFSVIGFKFNTNYQVMSEFGLISKSYTHANDLYFFFFKEVVRSEIGNPILGIVLLNGLRLFSDIYLLIENKKEIHGIFRQIRGRQLCLGIIL